MKFLLMPFGSYGDVLPFMGIGKQLMREGHDVEIATNEYFADVIKDAGLRHIPAGSADDYIRVANDVDMFSRLKGPAMVAKAVINRIEPVFEIAKNAMDDDRLVVGGILAMGARVAQEVTGKPYVVTHLAPIGFWSADSPPRFPLPFTFSGEPKFLIRATYKLFSNLADKDIAPGLNAFRSKFNLPPVKNVWPEWVHSPYKNMCLFPDWFAQPQSDWPANTETTSFPLFDQASSFEVSNDLDEFIERGEKPILFTGGSAFAFGHDYFRVAAEAVTNLNARAIFVTTMTDKVSADFGPNIHVCKHAPFSRLLPRCSVFVHHGGIGSTAQGIASGIPQLVKPMAFDQFDNGLRVKKLGIGEVIPHEKWNLHAVQKTLSSLLSDQKYQQAAAEKKTLLMKTDGIKLACETLTRSDR
ncbi:MAG: glycosyltransferase [Nitrospinales bacterium]